MKSQRTIFKWIAMAIVLAMFLSFANVSPSAFAQDEIPPTATETPTKISPEGTSFPTITPVPTIEESPTSLQPQSMGLLSASSSSEWPEFNISRTDSVSEDPSIATDAMGGLHIVWEELDVSGTTDVRYTFWNGQTLSAINVSASETFESTRPQIVVDSAARAHIVWEEQDDDYVNDVEIMYSRCEKLGDEETGYEVVCTSPVSLSGPPNWDCGNYLPNLQDWYSEEPIISIDQSDRLMVVWEAFEPGQVTQPYSTWLASGTPPSTRTGCVPLGGSGVYDRYVGAHRVAGGLQGDFRVVFEEQRASGIFEVYYSQYTNGSWASPSLLAEGSYPDLFLDASNQAHVTWCTADTLHYWNSSVQTVEDILVASCNGEAPIVMDSTGTLRVLWQQGLQILMSDRLPEGWSNAVSVNSSVGWKSRPDAVADTNGNFHIVWEDYRDENIETYYSLLYSCEGIEPASDAGKAVLSELEGAAVPVPFLNYCKNNVENVIRVPNDGSEVEAFQQWADLANSATYEVAFTVMFWDKDKQDSNPDPGAVVLQGISSLHLKVTDLDNVADYPQGMTVRILLGVQDNALQIDGVSDQRHSVLDEMKELDIPVYELLPDGRVWRVEVGLYQAGFQSSTPPGTYSHVKLMVVDNNKMIVSGYMPTYPFRTVLAEAGQHDLGLKVSGPIAANGMAVFDSLWFESEVLCAEVEDISQISNWANCDTSEGVNPLHFPFIPAGDDIALPLYRDSAQKTADKAVQVAIASADTGVFVLQNRVGVSGIFLLPPPYLEDGLENGLLEYADGLLKAANNDADIHILFSRGDPYSYLYNAYSLQNFYVRYLLGNNHRQSLQDLVRFYTPGGMVSNAPGLHAKSFLIDGEFLVIGSQNFDQSAFGNNAADLDLVEYSLGIEDNDAITYMAGKLETWWNNSGKAFVVKPGDSLEAGIQQANSGDVIIVEPGVYEITSTVNIPEGITIIGLTGATLKPAATFSNQIGTFKLAMPSFDSNPEPLLRINGSNVTLMGLTIQDSPGYAVEIGDGIAAFENVYLSRMVFVNNTLGGVLVQGLIPGSPMNYTIENNTFIGGFDGIAINVIETQAETSFIRDNIFSGQLETPIDILSEDDSRVEYSYNLFDDCDLGSCAAYWQLGNISTLSSAHDNLFDLDPRFSNPANGVYQLSSSSPAIDAGDPNLLYEFLGDGDNDGIIRIDIGAFEYVPDTNVPPVVNAGDDQTVELGSTVTLTASYSDTNDSEAHSARIDWGDGIIEDLPVNMTGPDVGEVAGQHTYASPGVYTIEICVVDTHGSVGCDTTSITVLYHFTGFFPPVDNQPILNVVKAGSAIPIKFSLNGDQGLDIFFAGYPASAVVTCGSSVEDAIEQTVTAGASSLSYDAATDQYNYVWKTDKVWANTCRTLVLKLNDGSYHRADFKFK